MNKTYKIVFNRARKAMMVANELTHSAQKTGTKVLVTSSLLLLTGTAIATPAVYTSDYSSDDDLTFSQTILPGAGGQLNGILAHKENTKVALTGTSLTVDLVTNASWTNQPSAYTFTGICAGALKGENGAKLALGSDKTNNISISVNTKGTGINSKGHKEGLGSIGIWAVNNYTKTQTNNGGLITLNSDSVVIDVSSESGIAYGILAQNSTTHSTAEQKSEVIINANNTLINVRSGVSGNASGLVGLSEGTIRINGNLTVNADSAIVARGNSVIRINENNNATVKLNGNINFNYDKATSGTDVDADVLVNLTGADSIWNGSSITSYSTGKPTSEDALKVNKLKIELSDGATWNPIVVNNTSSDPQTEGITDIPINVLSLNNGIINIKNSSQTVQVQNLSGTGGTINVAAAAENGAITKVGTLSVSQVTGSKVALNVNATGINADEIDDAEAAMTALQDAVEVTNSNSDKPSFTNTISEGAVKGAISQTVNADGTTTAVTQTENTKLTAFNSVSAMATMAWRHDMNDLTKRMGELRDSPEGIGSWVRFYGSEQEYGRQNVTSKSTSVQLGSDYDIGSGWKVGGAFTYTDGTSKYDNGSSDNKAYGVAAYGSWLADNGAFVDLIGKYSRLSSDFELSSMDGKSKNNALSASVEAGWHIPFAELAFIEPQAELTYGVVLGDDFTTSNGVKISQEDTEALIGRLGVRTGFHFPNKKGTVYARASVLHDFKGESEFTASLVDDASVRSTMKDDIGGTYYEIGVGANFNWTDNAYSYVDLEKQNGGDVKENWRWNVGFRYVW